MSRFIDVFTKQLGHVIKASRVLHSYHTHRGRQAAHRVHAWDKPEALFMMSRQPVRQDGEQKLAFEGCLG